jgi:lipoate-protein ligase A
MIAWDLRSPARDVFGQMALDEALAASKPELFCLRFFRWQGTGVTFGYAQRAAAVEPLLPRAAAGAWTRRPTGGGVVEHFSDLTFSCVFPAAGALKPLGIYERLHAAILDGLRQTGLAVQLLAANRESSPPRVREKASQCFAEPVPLDIMGKDGDKILGGAIRRYGGTVLYQGSLQLPGVREHAPIFEQAIRNGLAQHWDFAWQSVDIPTDVLAAAAALTATYRSAEWIRRR